MNNSVDGTDRLVHAIRSELRVRRMSRSALAERMDQNHDYVSMRLRREVPMTVEFLERVCEQLELSLWDFLDRARPREISKDLGPREFLKISMPEGARWSDAYGYLASSPRFGAKQRKRGHEVFPEARIRHMEDELWSSRRTAIEALTFWLSDIKESRSHIDREPGAYAAGLACLAGLIRSIHVTDAHLLLVEAFKLCELLEEPKLEAFIVEKAARLAWDLGHQELALRWLEAPSMLAHPLKDSYFSIRGAYYFYRRRFDDALDCFEVVDSLTHSDICLACSIDFKALITAERETLDAALSLLESSRRLSLPRQIENSLEWTRARVLQLHGKLDEARTTYEMLLPLEGDPQRQGYLLIDYLNTRPDSESVSARDKMIEQALDRLNPHLSLTDASVFDQLMALRRRYSREEPVGSLMRQVRPGG